METSVRRWQAGKKEPAVTPQEVAGVVSQWTGIPLTSLTQPEKERLLQLETELHKRVIGQDAAVNAVARAVRRG